MNTLTDPFATILQPARGGERGALPMSWHDSSWDLSRGLEISTQVPPEWLPHEWQPGDAITAPCAVE
jgi:hypothetical protein